MLRFFPCTLITVLSLALSIFPMRAGAEPVPTYATHGIAVSAEPIASGVGVDILKAGGNAFDAAAAVGFALAVTYPEAGNLGGGGFCVALTADGEALALDFREAAPAAAHRDMYLDEAGNVVAGLSLSSHLAVGVPGSVDGLLQLQAEHGRLTLAQVVAPAIDLAQDGFQVSHYLAEKFAGHEKLLGKYAASKATFYPEGHAAAPGETLVQTDLAGTLARISEAGREGFYEGPVADLFVAEMKRGGGLITHEDLKNYQAIWREPIRFEAGGCELITHPMPSSGGVTLAQILGLVDLAKLKAAGYQSAQYVHLLTEAERLAYADRNYFLGDADFVDVPIGTLISDEYLSERKKLLPENVAGKSSGVAHGPAESEETTHFCVADRWGNVVAITTTLNARFGMGAVVEGAGFLLNNEMDDFSAKPGVPNLYGLVGAEANAVAPGKRMLSSMTPTIVLRDGDFWMTMGSPGGSTIITTVLQIFLNATLFDMNVREAIDAGRVHHQWLPDVIAHEPGALAPETIDKLKVMGYKVTTRKTIGMAAGIQRVEGGDGEAVYAGYADRRGAGAAAGY